uniref:SH3 domain-binding protein 5 n=1 Tax=Equus caballus TaxID=9796 RepID=F6QWY6_HORSE
MDAALKRGRSEEPAELVPSTRDLEEEEEEGMEQGLEEEEEVDPRIQGELEKLNQSTDDINRRETELEDARQKFRSVLVEATVKLDELVKKIGKAVEDSKPYWEARKVARQAQLEAQKATQDFQRATEVLRAAKETISLAEQRLLEDDKRQFDSAWQEMLNHATQRVMEAEQTKTRSELVHKETAARYNAAMGRMRQLEKKLKRAINKSKPYFELKAKYYVQLEQLKKTVDDLQAKLALAKGEYKTALKNLEMISDEIHERRRSSAMGPRGCGVGAEGSSTSVEDLAGSKPEPDAVSVASEAFEDDNCSNFVSEDDSETQSVSSFSSGPTSPSEMPDRFPAVARPGSLDLPSPVSLSEFGLMFPVLGPRSECSGASSPECEVERVFLTSTCWRVSVSQLLDEYDKVPLQMRNTCSSLRTKSRDRAEGAENKTSDKANNNRGLSNSSGGGKSQSSSSPEGQALESRMKRLSLQCAKGRDGILADLKVVQIG